MPPPGTLAPVVIPLLLLVGVLCVALAAWAGWFVARDRAVILRQLWGAAVVEGVLLVQGLVAVVQVLQRDAALDGVLFWGYYVTALVILPVAALWAFAERTRWSSVVLLAAALVVAFLELRLWQIWEA
ncbi:hypothetical protein CLV28_1512 [Sediminihabitans luteus]|uniref:Uncharacterized protein n=1 Tax=Sediminihabitans luteus TaxID=1138585 RepID=A0A2M9CQ25_9CELL|nr:hypothetical protein CLV28_1512 [Sediminihabitans luteus]